MKYVTQIKNHLYQNLDLIFRLFIEPWKGLEYMFKIFELVWNYASRHTTEYRSERSKDIDRYSCNLSLISPSVDKIRKTIAWEQNKFELIKEKDVTKRRNLHATGGLNITRGLYEDLSKSGLTFWGSTTKRKQGFTGGMLGPVFGAIYVWRWSLTAFWVYVLCLRIITGSNWTCWVLLEQHYTKKIYCETCMQFKIL